MDLMFPIVLCGREKKGRDGGMVGCGMYGEKKGRRREMEFSPCAQSKPKTKMTTGGHKVE